MKLEVEVSELDLAKEFFPAATAKTFAGDRVTLTIRDGLEHLSFRFELTKEEIAELVRDAGKREHFTRFRDWQRASRLRRRGRPINWGKRG